MSILFFNHRQVTPPGGGGGGGGGGDGGGGGGGGTDPPPIATPTDPPIVVGSAAVSVNALVSATLEVNVSYNVGQTATTKCTFRVGRTPLDPPTVTLTLMSPLGVAQAITGGFLHDTTGEYLYDYTLNVKGSWTVKWVGAGQIVDENGHTRTYTAVETKRVRVS